MRARVFIFMMFTTCTLTMRTYAERVACGPALAEIFAETHVESSEQTPALFEKKKEAFLAIYRAATEGLSFDEFRGLMRQPFDFKDFVDATQLALAHEKFMQLKKILPNFSDAEQSDLMNAIQTLLNERVSLAQESQKTWNEKRKTAEEEDSTRVQTLKGPVNWVTSVAFSPDGTRLAAGTLDLTTYVWNLNDRTARPLILIGENIVKSVAFSPDGKTLASANGKADTSLWNLEQPSLLPVTLTGHKTSCYFVDFVAFSPDGKILAASNYERVYLWDPKNPTATFIPLEIPKCVVNSVAFSPDSKLLASGSDDGIVRIWNPHHPSDPPMILDGHRGRLWSLAFSPDGNFLAAGSEDKSIRIWNLRQRSSITLEGHTEWVNSVVFSPHGRFLASGSTDGTVRIWDPTVSRSALLTLETKTGNRPVKAVAFSPDGKFLVSSKDENVYLWPMTMILSIETDRLEEDGVP